MFLISRIYIQYFFFQIYIYIYKQIYDFLRLFQKTCSGATRSSHQLLVNSCTVTSSSFFTLLLKIRALSQSKLFVLTKMCEKNEFRQESGQISHQVDGSLVNILYEPSPDSLDQFKYKFHAQLSYSFQVMGENPTFKNCNRGRLFSGNIRVHR